MNRREALALLSSLPLAAVVKVERLAPDDVIVVEATELLSHEEMQHVSDGVSMIWPGHKVIVMLNGMSLKIARKA